MNAKKPTSAKAPAKGSSGSTSGVRPAQGRPSGATAAPGKSGGAAPAKPAGPAKPLRRMGNYKANLGTRLGAGAIDLVTGFVPALVFFLIAIPQAGVVVWLLYLLLKDGLPIPALEYRSIGKKIVGLHVEDEQTGEERIQPVQSIKRNAPAYGGFLLLAVLWDMNLFIGLALAVIPAIVEIVMITRDENGARIGDKLGRTRVLD